MNETPNQPKTFGEKFKDEFGDHFAEDIKKLIKYVEDLPKENQINI